ncbi:hypothetical protein GSI_04478 [Ganoderma sinense ZZ0214-1]|uniref:Protein kinase domain-containing protein n=1 Tax=Ganoderma sinense ZZ0214-1 TaxID=1077348 RepID=A0A2G8SGX2_9APHY|nr:hypothetical protein GSI_04478 [Ganoderma sinense ZZ0214-1]
MVTPIESKGPGGYFYCDIPQLTIDQPFPNVDISMIGGENGYEWYQMKPFWRAYRPWLVARGFHLFEHRPEEGYSSYILPPPTQCPPALPYAIYGGIEADPSFQVPPPPKFAPARDSYMRDVMIKLLKKGSEEHGIYQDLLHCSELSGQDFQGVLPPVAILDSQHDFSFVVMPRWGNYAPLHTFQTIGGALSLMRCLLKSLAFLHSRRIVHRDIDFHNIMVNYYVFAFDDGDAFYRALEEHRQGPDAYHCLMDFDRSLKLPLSTSLDTCRLSADESMVSGTPYQPPDLNLAEHDYNPFAYDVGCLGNMFRTSYIDIVPAVPMLAPLFDQMTTHVISERFKAADALAFLEDATRQLPGDVLCTPVQLKPTWDCLDDSNVYWAKVPPGFRTTPGIYRTPPPSLTLLTKTIDPLFTAGTIVVLNNELRIAQSTPVKGLQPYAGQSSSANLDASAQVKIHIWHQETTVANQLTRDGGRKAGSIQDQHVVHAFTSQRAPEGGWDINTPVKLSIPKNDGTTYTTATVSYLSKGVKLPIENGTVGRVVKCMTPTNRPRTDEQQLTSNRTDWCYVIRVGLQQTEWKWIQYGHWVSVSALEPLHPHDPAVVALHNLIASTDSRPQLAVVSEATTSPNAQ